MAPRKAYGDQVRDILGSAPPDNGDDMTRIISDELGRPCKYHAGVLRRGDHQGTALAVLGDAMEDIKASVDTLNRSMTTRRIEIAVLQTKAVIYGALGAAIATPIVYAAVTLLFHKPPQ